MVKIILKVRIIGIKILTKIVTAGDNASFADCQFSSPKVQEYEKRIKFPWKQRLTT